LQPLPAGHHGRSCIWAPIIGKFLQLAHACVWLVSSLGLQVRCRLASCCSLGLRVRRRRVLASICTCRYNGPSPFRRHRTRKRQLSEICCGTRLRVRLGSRALNQIVPASPHCCRLQRKPLAGTAAFRCIKHFRTLRRVLQISASICPYGHGGANSHMCRHAGTIHTRAWVSRQSLSDQV